MLWFMAMESGEAAVVSGFTAAYPVVTVVAAVVGLGATLLPLQAISIALLVGATFLLSWVDEDSKGSTNRAWLAPMILAVLLWGAWGVFEKLAIASMGFAGNAGIYVLVSTPMMLALGWRESRKRGPVDRADIRAAQPTLILFAVAGITIFLAIGLGPLAVVVPLTTAYPIVAILFRRYWMEEELTRAQKIAVGLAIVGAALVGL
jgi:drug/metabolite transporter (DMT)-like permease